MTIDDMIAQLLKEKADEISRKDFCADASNVNQLKTEKEDREKSDLTEKIKDRYIAKPEKLKNRKAMHEAAIDHTIAWHLRLSTLTWSRRRSRSTSVSQSPDAR